MPSHHPHNSPRPPADGKLTDGRRNGIQWIAAIVGTVFVVVGIGSALPSLPQFGVGSAVHVVVGVVGWLLSGSVAGSRRYLLWGGVLYVVLTLTGLVSA